MTCLDSFNTDTRSRACLESGDRVSAILHIAVRKEVELTLHGEKGDCSASGAGTASTSNAVDIILRVVGVVIVQHMRDIANILKSES